MQIGRGIANVLAFRTFPTTVLVIFVYVVLFGAVLLGDRVPEVPKDQNGLNLAQAYTDLHHIAERPHPVLSHANDIVRSYILNRVRNIGAGIEYVEVYEDLVSNASWAYWGGGAAAVYSESTNILVKIEGSDPESESGGGVLFSAHYDSVSTASGATDDGMGVATLIQLVEYLAKNRPKRTAVFNINNGEEDGLCGAFTFLKHPWSNLTDSFLNLEGASSGGRPLLFRATSTPALRSFYVPHPHANVLSADAFARGVIRSGTDYSVYTGVGMEGLDLAFYKGRSKYHTKYDAIPYTEAQERALWTMMEAAQGSSSALLNNDWTHGGGSPPVYFDLFGKWLILFSMASLLIANIVLLVVGPIILILLVVLNAAAVHPHSQNQSVHASENTDTLPQQFWIWLIEFGWLQGTWMWAKFWVAALVTLGLQALLMFGYIKLNPFIIYSHPASVFVSSFTLAYLTLVFIVTPNSNNHIAEEQKHTMFLQTYIFTWFLLVGSTFAVSSGIGGLYFVTAWNGAVLLACVIGYVENMLGVHGSRFGRHVHRAALLHRDNDLPAEDDSEATETTPLVQSSADTPHTKDDSGASAWWILQFVLAVSVPVTLVAHITVMLLGMMIQSVVDGNPAGPIYAAVSLLVFMLVLPVVPFTFKLHSGLASLFIIVFVFTTAYNLLAFPFSQMEPFKVFFQQKVALGDISSPHKEITHATTTLTGLDYYMKDLIIPKLPSAIGQNVTCSGTTSGLSGLETCQWNTTLLPSPGAHHRNNWLRANATRLSPNSARFVLWAPNTRGCKLYFDNKHITHHSVLGAEPGMLPQFSGPEGGIIQLFLWSRSWDRTWSVDVGWEGDSALEGRVACEWAEYESGSVGVGVETGKIPALEEVLAFLPRWAAVTMITAGLVEAWGTFSV
ncbi:hypothetical protein B0H19DRAFT_1017641 [Mycena capillaripes]|nr:hypothetical protein B0H19DRAFT_1017641 [Mycena capillaripes]